MHAYRSESITRSARTHTLERARSQTHASTVPVYRSRRTRAGRSRRPTAPPVQPTPPTSHPHGPHPASPPSPPAHLLLNSDPEPSPLLLSFLNPTQSCWPLRLRCIHKLQFLNQKDSAAATPNAQPSRSTRRMMLLLGIQNQPSSPTSPYPLPPPRCRPGRRIVSESCTLARRTAPHARLEGR
jgi:hypothetical protein